MRIETYFLVVLTFTAALTAKSATQKSVSTTNAAPLGPKLEPGKAVYDQHCAACHGVNGDGNGLAAVWLYALEHQLDAEQLALCRSAQKLFLREHLGRWTPAFTRRLARTIGDGTLAALADFAREFVAAECARFDITPGSEDLLLRPVNQADESLRESYGIASRLPGALQTCGET